MPASDHFPVSSSIGKGHIFSPATFALARVIREGLIGPNTPTFTLGKGYYTAP